MFRTNEKKTRIKNLSIERRRQKSSRSRTGRTPDPRPIAARRNRLPSDVSIRVTIAFTGDRTNKFSHTRRVFNGRPRRERSSNKWLVDA